MPYNVNIPQANDTFATSQVQILENYQEINNAVNVNHAGFNIAAAGLHSMLSFNQLTATPAFNIGEIGLFAVSPVGPLPVTNRTELMLTTSAGNVIPLTARVAATTGWCYLPSGLLMKWGQSFVVGNGTITFPVGPGNPVFNNVYNVQASIINPTNADVNMYVIVSSFTTTTATFFVTNRTSMGASASDINYFVIGD